MNENWSSDLQKKSNLSINFKKEYKSTEIAGVSDLLTDDESSNSEIEKMPSSSKKKLKPNPASKAVFDLTDDYLSGNSASEDDEANKKILSTQNYFEKELKSNAKYFLENNQSWTCARSSKEQVNHNKHITDKLEQMSSIYENTKDKLRAIGYQKAIMALKRCPHEIKSYKVNTFEFRNSHIL